MCFQLVIDSRLRGVTLFRTFCEFINLDNTTLYFPLNIEMLARFRRITIDPPHVPW